MEHAAREFARRHFPDAVEHQVLPLNRVVDVSGGGGAASASSAAAAAASASSAAAAAASGAASASSATARAAVFNQPTCCQSKGATFGRVVAPRGRPFLRHGELLVPVFGSALLPEHLDSDLFVDKFRILVAGGGSRSVALEVQSCHRIEGPFGTFGATAQTPSASTKWESVASASLRLTEELRRRKATNSASTRCPTSTTTTKTKSSKARAAFFHVAGQIASVSPVIKTGNPAHNFFFLELSTCDRGFGFARNSTAREPAAGQPVSDITLRIIFRATGKGGDELRWHPFLRVGEHVRVSYLRAFQIVAPAGSRPPLCCCESHASPLGSSDEKVMAWALLKLSSKSQLHSLMKKNPVTTQSGFTGSTSSEGGPTHYFGERGYAASATDAERLWTVEGSLARWVGPGVFELIVSGAVPQPTNSELLKSLDSTPRVSADPSDSAPEETFHFSALAGKRKGFLVVHAFCPISRTRAIFALGKGARVRLCNVHPIFRRETVRDVGGDRPRKAAHSLTLLGFGLCMRSQLQVLSCSPLGAGEVDPSSCAEVRTSRVLDGVITRLSSGLFIPQKLFAGRSFSAAANVALNFDRLCRKFLDTHTALLGEFPPDFLCSSSELPGLSRIIREAVQSDDSVTHCHAVALLELADVFSRPATSPSVDVQHRDVYWEFLQHACGCSLNVESSTPQKESCLSPKSNPGTSSVSCEDSFELEHCAMPENVRYCTLSTFRSAIHALVLRKFGRPGSTCFSAHTIPRGVVDCAAAAHSFSTTELTKEINRFDQSVESDCQGPSKVVLLGMLRPLHNAGEEGYASTGCVTGMFILHDSTDCVKVSCQDVESIDPNDFFGSISARDSSNSAPSPSFPASNNTQNNSATIPSNIVSLSNFRVFVDVFAGVDSTFAPGADQPIWCRISIVVPSLLHNAQWWAPGMPRFLSTLDWRAQYTKAANSTACAKHDDPKATMSLLPEPEVPPSKRLRGREVHQGRVPLQAGLMPASRSENDYFEAVVYKRLPVLLRPGSFCQETTAHDASGQKPKEARHYSCECRAWARVTSGSHRFLQLLRGKSIQPQSPNTAPSEERVKMLNPQLSAPKVLRCKRCSRPGHTSHTCYASSHATTGRPLPRRPDWTCPGCGNVNFARRVRCNMCKRDKPCSGPDLAGAIAQGATVPGANFQTKQDWTCTHCKTMNFARRTACFGCARGRLQNVSKTTGSAFGAVAASRADVPSSTLRDSSVASSLDGPLNVELVFSNDVSKGGNHDLHSCLAALSVGRTVRVLDFDVVAVHQAPATSIVASVLQARRELGSPKADVPVRDGRNPACLAVLRISPRCRLEFLMGSTFDKGGTLGVSNAPLPVDGLQATPNALPQLDLSPSSFNPLVNSFGLQSLGSLLFCEAFLDNSRPGGGHVRPNLNDKEAKKRLRRWKNIHETLTKICSFEAIVVDLVWSSSVSGALSDSEAQLHNLWQKPIRNQVSPASVSTRSVTLWNLRVSVVSPPGTGCHAAKIYFNAMVTRSPPSGLYRGGRFRFYGFLRNVSWKLNSISFQATETSCLQALPESFSRGSASPSIAVPSGKGLFPWMSTRGSAHSSIAACVRATARIMALYSSVWTGDTLTTAATVDCRTIAIRGAQIRQIKSVFATWQCRRCHRTRRARNFTADMEEPGACQCPVLVGDDAVHLKATSTTRISISAAADIDDGTGEARLYMEDEAAFDCLEQVGISRSDIVRVTQQDGSFRFDNWSGGETARAAHDAAVYNVHSHQGDRMQLARRILKTGFAQGSFQEFSFLCLPKFPSPIDISRTSQKLREVNLQGLPGLTTHVATVPALKLLRAFQTNEGGNVALRAFELLEDLASQKKE